MEQIFGPNPGRANVKYDPSDNFSITFNDKRRLDGLIGKNAFFEINNCAFLGDDSTSTFTIINADYAYIFIRAGHFAIDDCVWSLRRVKKTIFGHRKMSGKQMPNQLRCGLSRLNEIETLVINNNWNFYQLYTYMRSLPGSRLPEYSLPDKGQVPYTGSALDSNSTRRRLN